MFGRLSSVIVALAVTGVAGSYLASAPFRTNANLQFKQFTEWTPENIAKDPRGYLAWLGAELRRTEEQVIAQQVGVNQRLGALRREEATLSLRIENSTGLIDELRAAQAKAEWPAKVRMRDLTQKEVEAKLIEGTARLEAAKKRLAQVRGHQAKAATTLAEAEQMRTKLKEEQMGIASMAEEVTLRGSSELLADLSGLRERLDTLHDQSAGVVAVLGLNLPGDKPSSLTFDELLGE